MTYDGEPPTVEALDARLDRDLCALLGAGPYARFESFSDQSKHKSTCDHEPEGDLVVVQVVDAGGGGRDGLGVRRHR